MSVRPFDSELFSAGLTLTIGYFEKGMQDFIRLAQTLGRDLGQEPIALRPYLRTWYNATRNGCADHGIDVSQCWSEDQVIDAVVTIDEWGQAPYPPLSQKPAPAREAEPEKPSEEELRHLMQRALTTPTPASIMAFASTACRQRRFAPYNVYMIFAQRPGAGMVASREDWAKSGLRVRDGAIPILILRPMGPIEQVFEELDIENFVPRAPENDALAATGFFNAERLETLIAHLGKPTKRNLLVRIHRPKLGANLAGWIQRRSYEPSFDQIAVSTGGKDSATGHIIWDISINRQHSPTEQFVTLLHELGHLFCGHVGAFGENNLEADEFGWPNRSHLSRAAKEVEAELVAWWLAEREGIVSGSPLYLKPFLEQHEADVATVDLDRVTRAVVRIRQYLKDKR